MPRFLNAKGATLALFGLLLILLDQAALTVCTKARGIPTRLRKTG